MKNSLKNRILKKSNLKYLWLIPVFTMAIIINVSFTKILTTSTEMVKTGVANNIVLNNKTVTPKYEIPKEEKTEEIKVPKVIVAPINDKEDKQASKRDGNSRPTNVNDAKSQYETSGTSVGIDVSKWQGNINWRSVKNSGVEFAMIRVGYRGSVTGKIVMDPYFYQNVKGAINNGINVGIYFFSMARNEIEAREEALWTINVIKNYRITYPVAFDLESFGQDRLAGVSNAQLNKNAVAFLNEIKNGGYTPMHYGSKSKFGTIWNMNILNNYKIWLAHYTTKTNYSGKYNMWQYSSKGSVPGIKGYVDMNIAYFKYTNNSNEQAKDDSEVSVDPNKEVIDNTAFTETKEQVKLTANLNFRKSPTTELDNSMGVIASGTELTRTGISSNGWSRVIYNNNIGYVSSDFLEKIDIPIEKSNEEL